MNKLGRGLEALIQSIDENVDDTTKIATVKIDRIVPNEYQPRKVFNDDKMQELANSLKENGIIQPIIVSKKENSIYELIAGERRLQAAKIAGFTSIPVIIRSLSSKEKLQFAIVENVQRENLNAIEEANAYHLLNKEFGLSHLEIAAIVGKDRATISNFIRLLKLNDYVQTMILKGEITSGHARAILQVNEKFHKRFAEYILKNKVSVRYAEQLAKDINEKGEFELSKPKNTLHHKIERKETEKKLKSFYSVRIKVSERENKGKISFYYNSQDEFANLLEKLTKK